MIDLLIELLFNRLGVFILGGALVVGGVYVWLNFRTEARFYDDANGPEGRSAVASVEWKNRENRDTESGSTNTYFDLEYEHEGDKFRVKKYVEPDEYAAYELGDTMTIRFHPTAKQLIYTPASKRPSTWFASGISILLIAVGALIMIVVVVSLF